jgi:predicted transposase YdaD
MTLPEPLETVFKEFTQSSKIEKKMPIDKETLMLFGGRAVVEIQEEAREQGEARGEARGREQERELIIMNLRRGMGLSAQQIADVQHLQVQYVQSVIEKFEKKE